MRGITAALILITIAVSVEAGASELPTAADFCFQSRHNLDDMGPGHYGGTRQAGIELQVAGTILAIISAAAVIVLVVAMRNPANSRDDMTMIQLRVGMGWAVASLVGGCVMIGGGQELSGEEF